MVVGNSIQVVSVETSKNTSCSICQHLVRTKWYCPHMQICLDVVCHCVNLASSPLNIAVAQHVHKTVLFQSIVCAFILQGTDFEHIKEVSVNICTYYVFPH